MTIPELVETLRSRGVTLEPQGDQLRVRPASRLTAEEMARLRVAKPAVLAYLSDPRPTPPPEPAAGLSASSLAAFAGLGRVVQIESRTLEAAVYLCPDAASVAWLVEDVATLEVKT